MKTEANRTYHWLRRSREEIKRVDESTSIERQRELLLEDDKKKGYIKVDELCFPGTSGDAVTDKELKPLIEAVVNDKFDILKARDVDRLSRGNLMMSKIRNILEPWGKKLDFVWETYEDSPIGMGQLEIRAAIGEVEKGMSGMRFMDSRKKKARQGYFQGGNPRYGFKYDKWKYELYKRYQAHDPLAIEYVERHHPDFTNAGRLEIDDFEARIWETLYHWIDEGKSMSSWVRWFNDSGYRTKNGKKLTIDSVSRMIRDPIYKGYGYWNLMKYHKMKRTQKPDEEVCRYEVKVIVSPPLFDRVIAKLDANPWGKKSPRNTKHFYLLQGLPIFCTECGRKFRFSTRENGSYKHKGVKHYYVMKKPSRHAECYGTRVYGENCRKPRTIDLDWLEFQIWCQIVAELFDYVNEDEVVEKLIKVYDEQKIQIEADLRQVKDDLNECNLKRIRLLSAVRDNPQWKISQSQIDLQMKAISGDEERYKLEASKLESLMRNDSQIDKLIQRVAWVQKEFKIGSIFDPNNVSNEDKLRILNLLVDKVEIDCSNNVSIRLALPRPELGDSFVIMSLCDTATPRMSVWG